ncbi:MAG: Uma2 family endonuclease [Isosphaeraceae bacterium]
MATIPSRSKRARIRIGPGSAGLPMTPEEFDALPPSRFARGYRYEVINGVLVVSPPQGPGERGPNDFLGYLLNQYREGQKEGSIIDDTLPEQTVAATDRRRADRVIWTGLGRKPDELDDVPSIVIEFVSQKRRDALRDYEEKRNEYLAAGVKEYWIIDRFRRIMTVYRKGMTGPTFDVVNEGQGYETELLRGLSLPLGRILARADDWTTVRRRKSDKPTPPSGGNDG